jgi:hypothetical protein
MKAHRRITRAIRALAVTGCLAALAIPASAVARPLDYHPVSEQVNAIAAAQAYHNHGRPAAFAGDQPQYTLPAGFHTDGASSGYQPAATTSTQTPSVVVREFHSTTGDDHTLAIVLASAALGIALCGAGYTVFRTTRLNRRLVESS